MASKLLIEAQQSIRGWNKLILLEDEGRRN
jgi:hypothetical protein